MTARENHSKNRLAMFIGVGNGTQWGGIPEDSPYPNSLDTPQDMVDVFRDRPPTGGHKPDDSLPGELLGLAYPNSFPRIERDLDGMVF